MAVNALNFDIPDTEIRGVYPLTVWLIGLKPRSALKTRFLIPKSASPGDQLCRLGGQLGVSFGPFSLPLGSRLIGHTVRGVIR